MLGGKGVEERGERGEGRDKRDGWGGGSSESLRRESEWMSHG